ncbi:sulfatase family protein [Olivibacter domesticus]|uniref:Sulfatase N-terminal domain-containing protein n=1 Tax=Olivibacter domesticus TaxID=407022 RepID=A0A1H7HDU8_OLID1|nr:sulfatase [Olivibacter domesticus]SEK47140.1 protein of unknown function [Olivibacter domesticus]
MKNVQKKLVGLLLATAISTSLYAKPIHHYKEERPNIIIIMADDLDSRQLSCYGGQNIRTENIDQLASEGLKFNSIIASEAMCIPTRASLFTGLYPAKHGAYQNHKPVYGHLKSVVHYLNEAGYRVGLTGKNHVTKPTSVFPFDRIAGFEPNCVSKTDDYTLDSVRHYIQQKDPFCLFVMSINPHAPWTMGNPSEFDPAKLKLPAHWVDTKLIREQFCKYLAEVRRLDNQVGDIMKLLKETGTEENTIVIFLGEQGPQFPGGKWTLFDNGQKSSMIVKWPENVKAHTETDAIVQYEDITPTLIDIVGGKPVTGLDGLSFKEVLQGKTETHREVAYGIHNNIPEGPAYPIRSIRDLHYKFIRNLTPDSTYYIKYMMNTSNEQLAWTTWVHKATSNDQAKRLIQRIQHRPAIELYDLQKDPYELENLADKPAYQDVVDKYAKHLDAWMKAQGDKGVAMDIPINKNGKE